MVFALLPISPHTLSSLASQQACRPTDHVTLLYCLSWASTVIPAFYY